MELEPGVVIAGKYKLEQPLARGGMGSVWVAKHLQLKVSLAIKFMEPAYAASSVGRARFEREATASAQLRHPHVVHVQDYGVEENIPYIVMELLIGEDLGKRLKRLRKISLISAATIASQTAKALRRAHEAGFIHRDLKPSNVFLARDPDEDGELVKILDFGIAKQLFTASFIGDTEHTRTGEIVGSPSYMSPEQIRSSPDIDGRSDLWSLGVILFRSLTGQLPFKADTTVDIIAKILAGSVPSASELAPELPPTIDPFFQRALSRDREQRFQTAREMAEAFSTVARQTLPSISGVDMPAPMSGPESGHTRSPPSSGYKLPQISTDPPSSISGATSQAIALDRTSPSPTLQPTPDPHSGSFAGAQSFAGSTPPAPPDPLGLMPPAKPPLNPGAAASADSPTVAPSFGGTLTVSPSITGTNPFASPRRPSMLWLVIGGSTLVGAGLAISIILANRTDPSSSEEPGAAAQPNPSTGDPSGASTPTPPAADTGSASASPLSLGGAGGSMAPGAASTRPAASASASASARTKRPPVPGRLPGKKNDWGI